jgi:transketolase
VSLIIKAAINLQDEGIRTRVVSFPSWELFEKQSMEYRELVLPSDIKLRLAVEAGIEQGWQKYVGDEGQTICMQGYGASAPYQTLFEKFGFTVENVTAVARKLIR